MAQHRISERYLKELVLATLEGEVADPTLQVAGEEQLRISGRIYNDGSDPEETRTFLEELVEGELPGWTVALEGLFVSRNLPPNLAYHVTSSAQFPEAVYRIQAVTQGGEPLYRVWVRHQDQFLGRKRNRLAKLHETLPGFRLELLPLGRQEPANQLNTLPRVQEWLEQFAGRVPGFTAAHVHAYKVDSNHESIWLAHNSKASSRAMRQLARHIARVTDIAVVFEQKTSRTDARAMIEETLAGLSWLEGYQISFQEKNALFLITADAEQSRAEQLQQVARELAARTSFKIDAHIDIQRDVMVSRLVRAFPEDGILTWIKHIDASLYEVEAYIPFDPQQDRLNAWSDEMEAVWGAKILFSDPFMRAPDFRYRDLRGSDAETIALRYNRPRAFSPEALALAEQTAQVDWELEKGRRLDFRDTVVLSIDPERTKDIDDALSITQNPDGTYEVGVHIADVSAFVPQNSQLDQEAMLRGFTTYLTEGEIPVIPPILSDNACSLHGNKDSLCMSVFMQIDDEGQMLSFDVKRTIIHNYARLAYAQAQAMLNGREHPYAWQVRTLGALSRKMRIQRKASGALDLSLEDDPEKASHQLIEEFMLQANECVSRFLTERHPTGMCLFRVHPDVTENTMAALRDLAQHLKVSVKVQNQETMQKALEELLGTPRFDIFRYHVGRVLEKATYHVDQLGHGALAKEDYAHFTSPIRRYTDLIIHRLIEDALYAEERNGASSYVREELQVIADHLNHVEIRVDAASFESHRLSDLQHYDGVRRTYSGRILSFMRGRVVIKLDQTDLLVNVKYRDFKTEKMMPISINDELTDRYFTLGEEVNVRTEGVDWSSKSINARLVR